MKENNNFVELDSILDRKNKYTVTMGSDEYGPCIFVHELDHYIEIFFQVCERAENYPKAKRLARIMAIYARPFISFDEEKNKWIIDEFVLDYIKTKQSDHYLVEQDICISTAGIEEIVGNYICIRSIRED